MISLDESLQQDSSQSEEELESSVQFMLSQNEKYEKNPFLSKLKGGKIKSMKPVGSLEEIFESYMIEMTQSVRYFCICYVVPHSTYFEKIPDHLTSLPKPYKVSLKTEKGVLTYEIYELDQYTTTITKLTLSETYWLVFQFKEILEDLNQHKLYAPILNTGLVLRRGNRLLYCGRGCVQQWKKEDLSGSQMLRIQNSRELKQVAQLLQKWLNGKGSTKIRTIIEMAIEGRTKLKHFFKNIQGEIQEQTESLWSKRLQKGFPDSFILPTLLALQQFNLELLAPQDIEHSHTLFLIYSNSKQQLRQIILSLLGGMLGQAILNGSFSSLCQKFYFQLKCMKHSLRQIDENQILGFLRYVEKIIRTEKNTEKAIKQCMMRLSVDATFISAACQLFEQYVDRDGLSLHSRLNDLRAYSFDAFGYYFDVYKYNKFEEIKLLTLEPEEVRIVKIKENQHQFGFILPSFWKFACSELIYFFEVDGQMTPCELTSFSEWDYSGLLIEDARTLNLEETKKETKKEQPKKQKAKSSIGSSLILKQSKKFQKPKVTVQKDSARFKEMFTSQEKVQKSVLKKSDNFKFGKAGEYQSRIAKSVRPH